MIRNSLGRGQGIWTADDFAAHNIGPQAVRQLFGDPCGTCGGWHQCDACGNYHCGCEAGRLCPLLPTWD